MRLPSAVDYVPRPPPLLMIQRELKVLVLGEVPEVGDMFARSPFVEELPTDGVRVPHREEFGEALERPDTYNLIIVDLVPHGLEVVETVRDYRPACPVLAVADPDELEVLIEAERRGLEDYLLRIAEPAEMTELFAEVVETRLRREVEPPVMSAPSAVLMNRYSHFFNVLEPFFIVSVRRCLLYVNRAGQQLVDRLHDHLPVAGEEVEEWALEREVEAFQTALDRAFAGREVVNRRDFPFDGDEQIYELHYQPVVDPTSRVVAVTVAVHEPGRPQLQRARTSQAVSRFAGGIAHQMNNAMNILTTNLGLMERAIEESEPEAVRDHAERIRRGVERAADLTRRTEAFSRTGVLEREELTLEEVLGENEAYLREVAGRSVELRFARTSTRAGVRIDREQLEMAIVNLVRNGVEASDPGEVVEIRTDERHLREWHSEAGVGDGLYAVLEVEDHGAGIAEEIRDRIFEPFFTTHAASEHVGLGLALVRSVAEQAGGGIEVESREGEGTVVRMYLPAQRGRPDSEARRAWAAGRQPAEPCILIVEPNADLRETYDELFELDGYKVVTADGPDEALGNARRWGEAIDLVITALVLDDMRAEELLEAVTEAVGAVPCVVVSGYGEVPGSNLEALSEAGVVHLSRPFRPEALLTAVADLLAAFPKRSNSAGDDA